jgi:hypothetical protein
LWGSQALSRLMIRADQALSSSAAKSPWSVCQ